MVAFSGLKNYYMVQREFIFHELHISIFLIEYAMSVVRVMGKGKCFKFLDCLEIKWIKVRPGLYA